MSRTPRALAASRSPALLFAAVSLPPVLGSWWWLMHDQVLAAGPSPITPAAMAWIALATRVAGWGVEAAAFALLWAAADARLPLLRYALALAPLSTIDLCADALRLQAPALGEGLRPAIAVVAGIGALGPFEGEWRLLAGAFTAAGLLTLARIAAAALVQARLARVPWRATFALTFGLWLAHHVALWWALELTAGRSLTGEFAP